MTKQDNADPKTLSPPPSESPTLGQLIQFAAVGRPHGLKGAFFLKTHDRRTVWDGYKTVFLETPAGMVPKKVMRHALSGGALILELEGLQSIEAVQVLYDKRLFVPREDISVQADEYLVSDLVGYSVCAQGHGVLGTVIGVVSYGAQENLQIQPAEQTGGEVLLYPFIEPYVISVNAEQKQIDVQFIEAFCVSIDE